MSHIGDVLVEGDMFLERRASATNTSEVLNSSGIAPYSGFIVVGNNTKS